MEEQEETAYHTPNGIIKKLDTFKGKKALIGDYFAPSYYNTKMVLDSLGFEMTIVKTYYDVIEKIKKGEKYDVIFTNNIYQIGGTGPQLLKELKEPHVQGWVHWYFTFYDNAALTKEDIQEKIRQAK